VAALIFVVPNFLSYLACVVMHGCVAMGDLMLGVLLLDINLLESVVPHIIHPGLLFIDVVISSDLLLCFGTMVPIGTIDARLVPFSCL
jgi:hypothetical protein